VARRAAVLTALLLCAGVLAYVARAPERPLALQPFPDSSEYANSARSLADDKGFFTYIYDNGRRQPPRYPPGYPMALVTFASVGSYPSDVQRGAKFWALAYVLAVVVAAWTLGGPLAASLSALFVGFSPFARDSAGVVMSDAFVAALTVAVLPLLQPVKRSGARLGGALVGLTTVARWTAGVGLVALLAALPRRFYKPALVFAIPPLIGLALLQWALFGSPTETGYSYWGVGSHLFSLSYIAGDSIFRGGPWLYPDRLNGALLNWTCPCHVGGPQNSLPNLTFYPLMLASLFWVFSPPFVPLIGLFYAWRRRRDPVGRYALVLTFLTLVMCLLYVGQETRYMAGPNTILAVLASVWLAKIATTLPARWRVMRTAQDRESRRSGQVPQLP
jgi:4-amino-4-deoxy-L-arabinose transferase-like glycosyltransferase